MLWRKINNISKWNIFIIIIQFNFYQFVDSLACYSCLALNYRQNVLSRNDELLPPQNKENLSELFAALHALRMGNVSVSSSCADVTLTTQPYFLNNQLAICDKCIKMDFYYSGEKVVLRNCLSNLMDSTISSKLEQYCPITPDERSEISIGDFRNVTVCTCQSDLCNSTQSYTIPFFLLISLILSFS